MLLQLEVDASHVGAGAVLLQEWERVDSPVCYFSKNFNTQFNYSRIEKKALPLVWDLKYFEVYVSSGGSPVVVYTDHNPLSFLFFVC